MTITSDTAPVFPMCPTFGFMSTPRYRNLITERDGGEEKIDRKWSRPLHRYATVPLGEQRELDMQAVLYFWHALGGTATRFRFKDWADYSSAKLGETIAAGNYQPLTTVSDSPASWRLTKVYTVGSLSQARDITRPRGSTIKIYNESNAEQSDWTLDESTGVFTIGGTFSGTPTSWSGEFDVWCRFDGDLDIELSDHKIQRVTCAICEVRDRGNAA